MPHAESCQSTGWWGSPLWLYPCVSEERSWVVTDHHLRWQRKMLDTPGRPKHGVRVCGNVWWKNPSERSLTHSFDSFKHPSEGGDIESEWSMFRGSIMKAADLSCGHEGAGASYGSHPQTWWWTVIEVVLQVLLAGRTPEAAEGLWWAKLTAAQAVAEAKTWLLLLL